MTELALVDVIDHRRQRGRFARAGRAGDQNQPLRLLDQLAKHLGRGQVVERQHFRGNGTEHRTGAAVRSEEHTSELQSLMRISYAVFCLKKKKTNKKRPD